MGIRQKVIDALKSSMPVDFLRLDDEDGIIGFVVSTRFAELSSLDRQTLLDRVLKDSPDPLSRAEQRRVLMIAGITPDEWAAMGAPIRVEAVDQVDPETVRITILGSLRDGSFVGELLQKMDLKASDPLPVPEADGLAIFLLVRDAQASPLPRTRLLPLLRSRRAFDVDPAIV